MLETNNQGRLLLEVLLVSFTVLLLVAFLTPAYFSYLEKSRLTSYLDTANSIKEYCEVASIEASCEDVSTVNGLNILNMAKEDLNSVNWKDTSCSIAYDEDGNISVFKVKYGDESHGYEYIFSYDQGNIKTLNESGLESTVDGWFIQEY